MTTEYIVFLIYSTMAGGSVAFVMAWGIADVMGADRTRHFTRRNCIDDR